MRRKTQINNVEGKKQQITTSDNITIGIYGIWFNPHILGGLWTMQKIERNTILSTSCFFSAEERVFSAILGKKIKMIVVLRVVNVVGWLVFFCHLLLNVSRSLHVFCVCRAWKCYTYPCFGLFVPLLWFSYGGILGSVDGAKGIRLYAIIRLVVCVYLCSFKPFKCI